MSGNISKNMKIAGFSGNFAGIGGSCVGGSGGGSGSSTGTINTIGKISGKGAAAAMHLTLHSSESDLLAVNVGGSSVVGGAVAGSGVSIALSSGNGVGVSNSSGNSLIIPLIRSKDNAKQLPTYNAAMLRSPDEYLAAEDLDNIQLELETLLSCVALRARVLKAEYENIDKDEKRNDRRNKEKQPLSPAQGFITNGVSSIANSLASNHIVPSGSNSSSFNGKRKRDEPAAVRKKHSSMTILKQVHHHNHPSKMSKNGPLGSGMHTDDSMDYMPLTASLGASGSAGAMQNNNHAHVHAPASHSHAHVNHRSEYQQLPKLPMPKNDMPNKFWLSVEPYCMPLTQEDIRLIDDLLEQYKGPLVPPIPPLGPHYSVTWVNEDMKTLQDSSNIGSNHNPKSSTSTSRSGTMLKKADSMLDECITGPLTQRLVSALIEEQMVSNPSEQAAVGEHSNSSSSDHTHTTASAANMPYNNFRSLAMLKNCIGIEQRVKKELMDQGILDMSDFPNGDEDEVLLQIKALSAEINSVANYNRAELTQLQQTATNEIKRIELKHKLDLVDQEILESYKRMLQYRAKRKGFTYEEQQEIYRLTREQRSLAEQLERLKMQSQPI